MPCTAKKHETERAEFRSENGTFDCDLVITTREFGHILRCAGHDHGCSRRRSGGGGLLAAVPPCCLLLVWASAFLDACCAYPSCKSCKGTLPRDLAGIVLGITAQPWTTVLPYLHLVYHLAGTRRCPWPRWRPPVSTTLW